MAARLRRLGHVIVGAMSIRGDPACSRAQALPGAMPEDTPSFITGDLGGTTSFVLPFPLDLWHSFLSKLEPLGIRT